jgi:hypothetical protein
VSRGIVPQRLSGVPQNCPATSIWCPAVLSCDGSYGVPRNCPANLAGGVLLPDSSGGAIWCPADLSRNGNLVSRGILPQRLSGVPQNSPTTAIWCPAELSRNENMVARGLVPHIWPGVLVPNSPGGYLVSRGIVPQQLSCVPPNCPATAIWFPAELSCVFGSSEQIARGDYLVSHGIGPQGLSGFPRNCRVWNVW